MGRVLTNAVPLMLPSWRRKVEIRTEFLLDELTNVVEEVDSDTEDTFGGLYPNMERAESSLTTPHLLSSLPPLSHRLSASSTHADPFAMSHTLSTTALVILHLCLTLELQVAHNCIRKNQCKSDPPTIPTTTWPLFRSLPHNICAQ